MSYVKFIGFAPDMDPTIPGVITDCADLIPTSRSTYVGAPTGVDVGQDALAAAALAAAICIKLDGTARLFAGTTTALYEKSGSAWTDVSRALGYSATTTNPWRFAQFGDTSLAVCKGNNVQSISTGADFADLNAPTAAVMCVSNRFVMLGNTNNGGSGTTYGDSPDRWYCSALEDETDWTPSVTTQCATGRLVDTPGAITAMRTLLENVVCYKENSMYLGTYVGPPAVWQFDLISAEVGCPSHESIVEVNNAHYFIGNEDIYRYTPGSLPVAIGAPIKEWFYTRCDPAYKERIRAAHDRANSLIYWFYPTTGSSGALDKCVVYNYKSDKWGVSDRSIECCVEYISGGYTYDTLPFGTYDAWPEVSYDSPFWDAQSRYTGYFGTDHKIYSLTGDTAAASLTTGSYGVENEFSLLSRVTIRYLNKPLTGTLINYYANEIGDTWTTDAVTTESSGRFDLLRSAPMHKLYFVWTGNVEVAGASADVQPDGVY